MTVVAHYEGAGPLRGLVTDVIWENGKWLITVNGWYQPIDGSAAIPVDGAMRIHNRLSEHLMNLAEGAIHGRESELIAITQMACQEALVKERG